MLLNSPQNGEITKKRYKNYLKVQKESAFNEMSYSEKKQKNKKFAKLIKATVKKKRR